MSTEERPRDLIERIAARNGVFSQDMIERSQHDPMIRILLDSNQNLKEIANNSTFRLAEDLNSVPTHFVLECIQNADDNRYHEGIEPFLRLDIQPDRIKLGCNEVGFSPRNVEAICSVGKSTKSSQSGYIGEKGIGFKSVFKVARHAHIYSPPFFFKFDKARELGMITPVWIEEEHALPTRREECQTTILLLPATGHDFSGLFKDFNSIAPTLLLFLRKLKRLELNLMDPPTKKVLSSRSQQDGRLKTLIVEDDRSKAEHSYRISTMKRNISIQEERRKGVISTEIALAFPVNSEGAPKECTQMVHAFLPIRNSGFKFIIQADFLVTSSRQDIDESKSWNHQLKEYVSPAFEQAVLNFLSASKDPLRYTWMRYLPQGIDHKFWRTTASSIWCNIKELHVLESRGVGLHIPKNLERLSDIALDRFGWPLVGSLSEYLSPQYADTDWGILSELGVKPYSQRELLIRLYRMEDDMLVNQLQRWHEDLAKCMESFANTQAWNDLACHIRHKKLIPLHDGSWSSAHNLGRNPIYFQDSNSLINIPSDVNLRLVNTEASADVHRKNFFRLLGVKDCNEREVAELILRKHHETHPPSLQDSIIHSDYIFMLQASIRDSLDVRHLWLYDESGHHAKGDQLYIPDDARYSAYDLLQGSDASIKFLSPSYGASNSLNGARQKFIDWLQRSTALTTIPRIRRDGKMSNEFSHILQHHSNEVIHILRFHWHVYRNEVNNAIRVNLENHQVSCSNGGDPVLRPLKYAYLPDPSLKRESSELCSLKPGVDFIMIEQYKAADWVFLTKFCAGNAPDLRFYLWLGKQQQFRQGCDMAHAKKLLQSISEAGGIDEQNQELIRLEFSANKLIRVFNPTSNKALWEYPCDCVWNAPAGFRAKYSLKPVYGNHTRTKILMKTTLRISNATVRDIVNDMASSRPSDEYLIAAYDYLANEKSNNARLTDLQFLRQSFEQNMLILIPGKKTRLLSSQCVWGGPPVSHKVDIQPYYDDSPGLREFFTSVLKIEKPSCDDIFEQLAKLKSHSHTTASQVEAMYAYLVNFDFSYENGNKFEDNSLYTKGADGRNCWRKPSECVWAAPSFLRSKIAISRSHMMTDPLAITFLRTNLGIRDANLDDFVEDVRILKRMGACDRNEIENLYRHIEFNVGRQQHNMRTIFTSEPLIYDHLHVPPRWVLLGECVWTGPICLHTTPKLARCYPTLKNLFCTILGASNASSDTIVEELLAVVDTVGRSPNTPQLDDPERRRITELLLGLSSLELSSYSQGVLGSQKIWPFQLHRDAMVTLVSITDTFFIPDHQHLLDVLNHNIPVLHLSSSDLTRLRPIFANLGVESKLISKSVRQTNSAEDTSMPDHELSTYLQSRADAVFHCGEHFRVNRLRATSRNHRELLRGIRVYRAADISTTYELASQKIDRIATRSGLMRLKINEDQLQLFVPRDQDSQRKAFAYCLAKEIIQFLEVPEEQSWQIISGIFTTPIDRLEMLLYSNGVLLYDEDESAPSNFDINALQVEEQIEEPIECSTITPFNQSSINIAGPSPPITPSTPSRNTLADANRRRTSAVSLFGIPPDSGHRQRILVREVRASRETTITLTNGRSFKAPTSNQIREALNDFQARAHYMTRQGRAAATSDFRLVANGPQEEESIVSGSSESSQGPQTPSEDSSPTPQLTPSSDAFDPANLASAGLVNERGSAPRDNSQRARDFGIGFLGEQFVVEMLKQHLPDFDELLHWTSTLRVHAGFPEYPLREDTDLKYCDTDGHLRRLLRTWTGEAIPAWLAEDADVNNPITFWLEVKTTTDVCETPFYVSSAQYQLMKSMAVSELRPRDVYVLLRVYNIGNVPGLIAYIDPWTRSQEGQLDFVPSAWVVTPRRLI